MQSCLLRMKRLLFAAATGALVALASTGAQASLLGTTTNCTASNPSLWVCSSPSATIGTGTEFMIDFSVSETGVFDVNFGADAVTITWLGLPLFDRLFSDLLQFGNLLGVTGISGLTLGGSVTGISLADVSLIDGLLQINISGSDWTDNSSITITFSTAPTGVPEPATLGLLAVALGGMVGATRRRRDHHRQ